MSMEYVDLIMVNGEITKIECPDKHLDELYESIDNAMKIGSWWSPLMFNGCKAEYLGHSLSRVAMNKVIGVL